MNLLPKMVKRAAGMLAVAGLCCQGGLAPGQSGGGYDLSWSSVDAGGAIISGGEYEMAGAVGQPDAETIGGGDYTLSGGVLQDADTFPLPAVLSRFTLD